ncbi:uncharacterized protein LOC112560861 isoform X2 [Pomacea canaliculata]|uniref:uncharacterized protein LOC112560861 isoform X2 n=1 Tax=Pomacea canaliculata TaxID=400727 RepID=UPI000D731FB7|nr:uncharacterized protein LOC112560861 isoform X2 [Pomacea canaliculata]
MQTPIESADLYPSTLQPPLQKKCSLQNHPGDYSVVAFFFCCGMESNGQDRTEAVSCPCERPQQWVVCCVCGFRFQGRVRKQCDLHPRSIYLMDISCCPECNCQVLREVPPLEPREA